MRKDIYEIRKFFGKNILKLRTSMDISQEEAAFELGVSRQHYVNLENGNVSPSFSLFVGIMDFFNCSADYLLGRTNNPAGYPLISNNIYEYIQESSNVRFDEFEITEDEKNKIIQAIRHALSIVKLSEK